MRYKGLICHLNRWQKNGLIDENHVKKITAYMKTEYRRQFLRILFVIGAFCVVFGIMGEIAAMLRLPQRETKKN